MKFRNIIIIIIYFFVVGCEQYSLNKQTKLEIKPHIKYNNTGFSLIYDDKIVLKKLDNRSLKIFHKSIKKKFSC